MKKHRVAVYRKITFNAAHRLYRKDWTDAQNKAYFGLCANENYHGHNYRLDVKVTGEIDPETGYVIDIAELKKITDEEVMERFDHRNLNLDCPEFKNLNPTGENIVVVIYELLRRRIDPKYDLQVRLYETERNYFEYPA
ncbi:MAG: 6-carboxytetrahydropterin synthase [Chitinophagales bacterium]|nr:6-carboxytetrahydropterin synthase [Chitinophagales bacterium]MDW8419225.1 6-carboxytetrahydropterin synthase [Chitinophagales bacterium]